jgi:hypothetical protein
MTYRECVLRWAMAWKLEHSADAAEHLRRLAAVEQRRVRAWGRRRFGPGWDRLEPRVRAQLVRDHGRDH